VKTWQQRQVPTRQQRQPGSSASGNVATAGTVVYVIKLVLQYVGFTALFLDGF
jgi:hypothetical protein